MEARFPGTPKDMFGIEKHENLKKRQKIELCSKFEEKFLEQCVALIKKLLIKAKNRKDSQSFIVEGIKEIKICFDANYEFIELRFCELTFEFL